jgi:hypothetical protein
MLAAHTPAPEYPMVRNEQLDELQQNQNTDPNVILYVALMKGITPIVTVGDHKAFVADFSKPKQTKRERKLPRFGSKVKDKLENTLRLKRLSHSSKSS